MLVNISRWWAGFRTEHRKLASLLREMDGFRDGGPLWDTLVRAMNEAGNFEAAETAKAIQRVLDILKPFNDKPRAARRAQHHVPEVNRSFTYEELIGVALNMGNETNRQRVLDGEGWSPAQVEAILKRLTKEDWDMVQSLWDFLDSFRPMIAEKERKITGNEPRWVEPRAVATPFGTYRGGYWPIKYDPLRSTKAEADTAAEVERQMLGGLYARATTRRGHLRERVAKVNRPMRYDFVSVLTQHIDQVIHDVAWHPWLVDANRLINAPAIDAAIRTGYGPEFLREIRQALRDIAVGHLPAQTQFDRAVAHVRTGATIAVMGWRFSTALVQPLGLTQSMVRVGPKWIARGLAQWFAGPKSMTETVDWIKSRSDFMRTRADTLQREIAEIHARVRGERRSPLVDLAFLPMQKMQLLADVPTWLGAYHKAMAEPNMTESRAIALADQAVIDSQGSGRIADLARVQRGSEGMKLFTNFYSFFNTTYNLAAERTRAARLKSPADVAALASDYLLLFVAPALLSALLRDALGKAPEGEDWDELLKRYAKELGGYVLGTMLGLREIGSVLGGFDYRGPAGLRVFADLGNLYKQIEQGEIDAALVKSLLSTGGVLFHAPTGQLVTTIDGIVALSEGRTDNPAALLVGGPPRH